MQIEFLIFKIILEIITGNLNMWSVVFASSIDFYNSTSSALLAGKDKTEQGVKIWQLFTSE